MNYRRKFEDMHQFDFGIHAVKTESGREKNCFFLFLKSDFKFNRNSECNCLCAYCKFFFFFLSKEKNRVLQIKERESIQVRKVHLHSLSRRKCNFNATQDSPATHWTPIAATAVTTNSTAKSIFANHAGISAYTDLEVPKTGPPKSNPTSDSNNAAKRSDPALHATVDVAKNFTKTRDCTIRRYDSNFKKPHGRL